MKSRLQLTPKTTVKVFNRQRLIIASTGFALALMLGIGVFMYGNFGNNTESYAALGSNMGFENNTTEWTSIAGTWAVNSTVSDCRSGTKSIRCSATTTAAKYRNTNSTITIPSSGTNYITVIAWSKASTVNGRAMVGVFNTNNSTESMPSTLTTLNTSSFIQITYTVLATNGHTYIPQLQASTSTSTGNVFFDDVMIYTSTISSVDATAPTSGQTLNASASGNEITLGWANGTDNQSGMDGVLILRASGVNVTNQAVNNQTMYHASSSTVGPTAVGSFTVVYNGPVATSTMNNPGATGTYTYLVYMRDKAYNYTTTPARIIVVNGTNLTASLTATTQLSGLYLPATCTLSVSSAASPTILSGSNINVYGTIINAGNLLNNQGGTVNMKNASVYNYNRDGSVSGFPVLNAVWETGSTCLISGVKFTAPQGLNQTFHHFTWNCNEQTSAVSLPNSFNVNGNISFIDSGPGNSVRTCWLNGTNQFKGNISCTSNADVCTNYGSNVKLNGTSQQTISYNVWFQNVEFNNPAGVHFTTDIWMDSLVELKSGTVTMASGKKFMTESGGSVQFMGGIIGVAIEPWPYETNPTYDLTYHSGGTTSLELTTSTTYLGRLNINCPGQAITLDKDVQVNTALNINGGKLITNGKLLWVKPTTAESVSAASSSYIQGSLRRNISSSGTISYSFPIGSSSSKQEVIVKSYSLTGITYLTASFNSTFTGAPPNPNTCKINGTPVTSLLNNGFWTVEPNQQPTSGNYEITLKAGGFTNGAASPLYYGIVKRNNSSDNWSSIGTHVNSTQSLSNGVASVTRSGLISFSDFGVGFGGGILPITLSDFSAEKYENDKVMIRWVTSAELNNAYFSLERSNNGIDFEMINEQEGAGTSTISHEYEFLDENPLMSTNYYRLKQVDFDGQFTYGPIKQVTLAQRGSEIQSTNELTIFPNPNNGQFSISGIKPTGSSEKIRVVVMDIKGSIVTQTEFNDGDPVKMDISDRPPGTYMVQITDTNQKTITKQIIVNR